MQFIENMIGKKGQQINELPSAEELRSRIQVSEGTLRLPIESRVRLAKTEVDHLRPRIMEWKEQDREDLALQTIAKIYIRYGLDNEEGMDAVVAYAEVQRKTAEEALRKTESHIYRNPLATVLYIAHRASRFLGKDKK